MCIPWVSRKDLFRDRQQALAANAGSRSGAGGCLRHFLMISVNLIDALLAPCKSKLLEIAGVFEASSLERTWSPRKSQKMEKREESARISREPDLCMEGVRPTRS